MDIAKGWPMQIPPERLDQDAAAGGKVLVQNIQDAGRASATIEAIRQSNEFDPEFYLHTNPDVGKAGIDPLAHYVSSGSAEGRRPNPEFDPAFYRAEYPDVAASNLEPFHHYLTIGKAENRVPSREARAAVSQTVPSSENGNLSDAAVEAIRQSGQFDHEFYLRVNPDVQRLGIDPLGHYVSSGSAEGRRPNPEFDRAFHRRSEQRRVGKR